MTSASFESILRSPTLVEKVCQQLAAMLRVDPGQEVKLPAERELLVPKEKERMRQLFQVRYMIEPNNAQRAAQHAEDLGFPAQDISE